MYPPPAPPPQKRPALDWLGWTGGVLALALTVTLVIFLACCFGGLWIAGSQVEKDQNQQVSGP